MKPRALEEKNPLELSEEAFYLLRRAPAAAWAAYALGGLPFVLGLLFFWSDMARSAFAAERLLPGSLALAAGFIWMKAWQAVFARSLQALLCGEEQPRWNLRAWLRTAVVQAFIQPFGLFLLPVTLAVLFPFGWVYAFFSNVTVLSGEEAPTVLGIGRRAWRQAMLWPMANHYLVFYLTLFGLFVFVNLYTAVLGIPFLLDRLLGIPSIFTQAPWAAMNSTLTAGVAALTYLCCDPLLKALYALRCFYGESLGSGQDLRAELRRCAAALEAGPSTGSGQGPLRPETAGARTAATPGRQSALNPTRGHVRTYRLLMVLMLLITRGTTQGADAGEELEAPTAAPPASQGSQGISSRALHESIERVIQKREYSWRLPRETVPKKANQNLTWVETLARNTEEVAKAVSRWVSDVLRWINARFSRGSGSGSGTAMAFVMKAVVVVLGLALVGFLFWLLWRLWRNRPQLPDLEAAALPATPDLTDENVAADQLPEEGWLGMARELLARGELRLAMRAFYLATLAHLAQRNLISLARFKSNQDYERELQRRGHALATVLALFSQNRLVFERVWYGRHEITPRALHEFAGAVERIKTA
jgi:hypothetical protein